MNDRTTRRPRPSRRVSLVRYGRRSALTALNRMLHHRPIHRLVGRLNRRFDFLASVFVAYPASADYASFYFSERALERAKWRPVLCAVMVQDGKLTVGMGITATEEEIRHRGNDHNLAALREVAESIALDLGARHVTYSGILPGLMVRRNIVPTAIEADVTATVVEAAMNQIADELGLPEPSELAVILLGANGFVGTALSERLAGRPVYPLDLGEPWPDHLAGRPALLVNVANRQALLQHIDKLWPELVLVNEVYPEPTRDELRRLHTAGVRAFHVVGVRARCFPTMPKVYRGGIPCCAAWQADTITPLVADLRAT